MIHDFVFVEWCVCVLLSTVHTLNPNIRGTSLLFPLLFYVVSGDSLEGPACGLQQCEDDNSTLRRWLPPLLMERGWRLSKETVLVGDYLVGNDSICRVGVSPVAAQITFSLMASQCWGIWGRTEDSRETLRAGRWAEGGVSVDQSCPNGA